ncbi:MAG: flagellar hook-basal body protein [Acidobacteriota bacterium]
MDSLTISAASGMRSRLESLEMLANNLANSATSGFKLDRESYNLYAAPEAFSPDAPDPTVLPVVERHWTDFSQGQLTPTGNPLDFALGGRGFFALNGRSGALYTRSGSFQLSPAGLLISGDGLPVRAAGGGNIQLQPNLPVEVAADGTVRQGGVVAARLEITDFDRPEALTRAGRNCFADSGAAGAKPAAAPNLRQGALEASNVEAPEAAIRLVNLMRQFETLQKAMNLGADMGRRAIEEVARV